MTDINALAHEARERILRGEIDDSGRARPEGPRKRLTEPQLRAHERALARDSDELEARAEWYRRRERGEILGPLEWHRHCWGLLRGEAGGWPSGAGRDADAESRTAELDAVIELAGGRRS